MIEHIIISGGGHNIIAMFGAITYLKSQNYIDFTKIKTLDGTSAGALLGFTMLLNIDDTELIDYIIDRPWEKIFDITPEVVFQAFKEKGLFDIKLIEQMMEPLLKTADIQRDITMLELYNKTGIEFTIYATELNTLTCVEYSYINSPNEKVLSLIYQSCAIPPFFKPVIESAKPSCLFDGGIFANYPLNIFLNRNPEIELDKILGIKLIYQDCSNTLVNADSNIIEYLFSMILQLVQHIIKDKEYVKIPNELLIYSKGMTFSTLKNTIQSSKERKSLIEEGKGYASVYHSYKH